MVEPLERKERDEDPLVFEDEQKQVERSKNMRGDADEIKKGIEAIQDALKE